MSMLILRFSRLWVRRDEGRKEEEGVIGGGFICGEVGWGVIELVGILFEVVGVGVAGGELGSEKVFGVDAVVVVVIFVVILFWFWGGTIFPFFFFLFLLAVVVLKGVLKGCFIDPSW